MLARWPRPACPSSPLKIRGSYRLEVTVDESELRLVRVGQVSPVTIDALGNIQLSGKVVQIVPAADPASRSFLVKVELPADARLRSGLLREGTFLTRRAIGIVDSTHVIGGARPTPGSLRARREPDSRIALRHAWQEYAENRLKFSPDYKTEKN